MLRAPFSIYLFGFWRALGWYAMIATMNVLTKTIDFFREVRVELTKVVWPTRTQTIQLTILVIMITLIVGFFIGIIDYGLTMLTQYLLIR